MLDDTPENEIPCHNAYWTLQKMGKPAVPSLIQALDHPRKTRRAGVAKTLWAIDELSGLVALARRCNNEPELLDEYQRATLAKRLRHK